jgi:hypothetical protein
MRSTKLFKWKAYRSDGTWRVYKNKKTAIEFAGEDGYVVDLYEQLNLGVKHIKNY